MRLVLLVGGLFLCTSHSGISQQVQYQKAAPEHLSEVTEWMRNQNDFLRAYFSNWDEYRPKISVTNTVFELSGSPAAQAAKEGGRYTIFLPTGVYHLSLNVANIFLFSKSTDPSAGQCISKYKSYLAQYYGARDPDVTKNTMPLGLNYFAETTCGLSPAKILPDQADKDRIEMFTSGFLFILIHEYAHILNDDFAVRATKGQEIKADSFASYHVLHLRTKEVGPIFLFALIAFSWLNVPVAPLVTALAPSAPERLNAIIAGARGYAIHTGNTNLLSMIDKEVTTIRNDLQSVLQR
jgi:hypothetical protein